MRGPRPGLARFVDRPGRGEILVPAAAGLEPGDLVIGYALGLLAARDLFHVDDGTRIERAGCNWLSQVAGDVDGGEASIDIAARGEGNAIIVSLAHVRPIAADQVEVRARAQPHALHERL